MSHTYIFYFESILDEGSITINQSNYVYNITPSSINYEWHSYTDGAVVSMIDTYTNTEGIGKSVYCIMTVVNAYITKLSASLSVGNGYNLYLVDIQMSVLDSSCQSQIGTLQTFRLLQEHLQIVKNLIQYHLLGIRKMLFL
jgi:hypothetical protein